MANMGKARVVIFGSKIWFSGSANSMVSLSDHFCHDNEIGDKIDYNLASIKDISDILPSNREFSGSG